MKTKTMENSGVIRRVFTGEGENGIIRMKTVDEKAYTAEFIVATEAPVVDGWGMPRSLRMSGAELANYRKNPVILSQHTHSPDMVIAKSIEVRKENNELIATAQFDDEDDYAMKIWRKIVRGYIQAASISFIPKRERIVEEGVEDKATGLKGPVRITTQWRMLEWSIVAVGADTETLGRSADVEIEATADDKKRNSIIIPKRKLFIPFKK